MFETQVSAFNAHNVRENSQFQVDCCMRFVFISAEKVKDFMRFEDWMEGILT